ncbi:hypothetical protein JI667_14460 [Bacillus sp. NTK074B]|uniref:hypothetical protein n=1 Tax=Bacillus sp. NTK074B TaxID=2802174 RepID=UPI001A908C6E|nr:hypothetical protein [Bacillus sp. NTK074B]
MKKVKRLMIGITVAICAFGFTISSASAASDSSYVSTPYGKLTSNAWRSSLSSSGNTYQFTYQTSAVYSGSNSVDWIKTTWEACASLRNSASMSIGISADGVSAGSSSSWQNVCQSAYWQNSNGAKGAYSETRNAVIKPSADYRSGTVSIQNEAKVKIKGDARSWSVNASV